MPFGIGPLELVIVLLIVLLVFGSKRLPELGRSMGSGMREFKDSVTGDAKEDDGSQPTLGAGAEQPTAETPQAEPTVTTGAASKPEDPFRRG
jgi:sec-independent protein translocase protein TatA